MQLELKVHCGTMGLSGSVPQDSLLHVISEDRFASFPKDCTFKPSVNFIPSGVQKKYILWLFILLQQERAISVFARLSQGHYKDIAKLKSGHLNTIITNQDLG